MVTPIPLPILTVIISIIIVNAFFTLWFIRYRIRTVKCRIMKEYGDSWEIIAEKKVKINESTFKHKEDEYNINPERVIFTHRKGLELYYNQGDTEPIIFKGNKKKRNSSILKSVLKSKTASKLLSGYKDKYYLFIIVCLLVCLIGISAYSIYTFNSMNNKLIEMTQIIANKTSGVWVR